MRRAGGLLATLAVLASAALTLAACGGGTRHPPLPPGDRIRGDRLTVYVSVPLNGASAVGGRAVVRGAKLALAHGQGRIGRYRVVLRVLDDSTPATLQWSAPQTTIDANRAVADRTTIGYIGDLNSGASAVSIPLLNRVGIAQISPASTAVGLTAGGPYAEPGEPQAYYPTTRRTFARVVPSDLVQAQVQVELQRQLGCHLTYVLYDDEYDGEATFWAFQALARQRGLQFVSQQYLPGVSSYLPIAQTVRQSGADCVMVAAIASPSAVALATQVAAKVPNAYLLGTSGLAQSSFTNPLRGGIPAAIDRRVLVTIAAGDPAADNPQAAAFERAYTRAYGSDPEPVAINGYESMSLMLSAIRAATDGGRRSAQRVEVVKALFATRGRRSPIGTYSIRSDGNTTLDRYGVYRVERGRLQFWRAMTG